MKSDQTHLVNKKHSLKPIQIQNYNYDLATDMQSYVESIVGLQGIKKYVSTEKFKTSLTKESFLLASVALESIDKSKKNAAVIAYEDNTGVSIDTNKTNASIDSAVIELKDKSINVLIDLLTNAYQNTDNYKKLVDVTKQNSDKLFNIINTVATRELPMMTTIKPSDYFINLFNKGSIDNIANIAEVSNIYSNIIEPIDCFVKNVIDFIASGKKSTQFKLDTNTLPKVTILDLPGLMSYHTSNKDDVGVLSNSIAIDYINSYKHCFLCKPDRIKYSIELGKQTRMSIGEYVKYLKILTYGVNVNVGVLDGNTTGKQEICLVIRTLTDTVEKVFSDKYNKDNSLFRNDKFSNVCDRILDILKQEDSISFEDQFVIDLFTSVIKLHMDTTNTCLEYCITLINSTYEFIIDDLVLYSYVD